MENKTTIRAAILTISDKGSRGERDDKSGGEIAAMIADLPVEIAARDIVPDEVPVISAKLIDYVDNMAMDLVITTGGTGVTPRDVTPEATRAVLERELPGMSEAMRAESLKKTPYAMISRALCGVRGESLIINLPGSPRAVRENLAVVKPALLHTILKIKGSPEDCGSS
ncbi:MAG: molybdenum cofactor biosynthesis protein B [Thermodesulfobacteriota bacterium]